MHKRRSGFTLVEILVVLGIIALLAALLFPAFKSAQEQSRQTTCQSNLQQIYLAVRLYYQDEKRYPDSLLDLMGEGVKYNNAGVTDTIATGKGTGYYRGGQNALTCSDDDTLPDVARASYGYMSKGAPSASMTPLAKDFTGDFGQYVWNYWGYRPDGFAYATPTLAASSCPTLPCPYLATSTSLYSLNTNPVKYSMSNRFAPSSTIITHCIYHRLPTAKGLNGPGELYADSTNSTNARDIVLRIDGTTKPVDVSSWNTSSQWQAQTP